MGDNYLAHYGVKGMTWKKHGYRTIRNGEYIYGQQGVSTGGRSFSAPSQMAKKQQAMANARANNAYINRTAINSIPARTPAVQPRANAKPTSQTAIANARANNAYSVMVEKRQQAERAAIAEAKNKPSTPAAEPTKDTKEKPKLTLPDIKGTDEKKSGKKGSSKKSGSGSKKSSSQKTSGTTTSSANTTTQSPQVSSVDDENARRILGDRYDEVKQKVADKLKQTGKDALTADEIKEIMGGDYDILLNNFLESISKASKPQTTDIDALAKGVMNGQYGNGAERQQALGANYAAVQQRVNQLQRQNKGKTSKPSTAPTTVKYGTDAYYNQTGKNGVTVNNKKVKHSFDVNVDNYLAHHGVKGQKWGIRRYQNEDGSYNQAGKDRYITSKTKLESNATRYGGQITKNGKYKASNGTVIAKSRDGSVRVMRRLSTSVIGKGLSAAGRGSMSKITGRSKESLKAQENREREALKEYYKVGGDRMLKKYEKLSMKSISDSSVSSGKKAVERTLK